MNTSVNLSAATSQLFEDYLTYILQQNQKLNLTAITSPAEARVLHLEDSLMPLSYILQRILPKEKRSQFTYCDMGTGAGFPGVPLALALLDQGVDLRAVLVDSTAKKILVINDWLVEHRLDGSIFARACRIEEYQNLRKREETALPAKFDMITARALSNLCSLLELATPLLDEKGHFLVYKGKLDKAELSLGNRLALQLGLEQKDKIHCKLDNGAERNILVYKKTGVCKIRLPRRVGMAQRKPLLIK